MADGHDEEAAAALRLRRATVVGRIALRAEPVAAILELLPVDLYAGDRAQRSGIDEFLRFEDLRKISEAVIHGQRYAVAAARIDHLLTFRDRIGERLLHQYMLTGTGRLHRHRPVQVMRRGHEHGLEARRLEQR